MKAAAGLVFAVTVLSRLGIWVQPAGDELAARARTLHASALVLDAHIDTTACRFSARSRGSARAT